MKEGAEQKALEKIQLLLDTGFEVALQTNINRTNLDTIIPTMKLAETMGVSAIRFLPTTPVPRMIELGTDICLTPAEFCEAVLKIAADYIAEDIKIHANIWQMIRLDGKLKTYGYYACQGSVNNYRDSHPVCGYARSRVSVTPEGDLVSCVQLSGWYKKNGISFGNVHNTPLKQLLTEGDYIDAISYSLGELLQNNPKCQTCPHWKRCLGGCRVFACIAANDYKHHDPYRCVFFDQYKELYDALFDESWHNIYKSAEEG